MALTTVFTPPSGCFNQMQKSSRVSGFSTDGIELWFIFVSSNCYPADAATARPVRRFFEGPVCWASYGYSPGVLPVGFTTVGGGDDGMGVNSVVGCRM